MPPCDAFISASVSCRSCKRHTPPKRTGVHGMPQVHKGFLATWAAAGIRDSVLPLLEQLAADARARSSTSNLAEADGATASTMGSSDKSSMDSDFQV